MFFKSQIFINENIWSLLKEIFDLSKENDHRNMLKVQTLKFKEDPQNVWKGFSKCFKIEQLTLIYSHF